MAALMPAAMWSRTRDDHHRVTSLLQEDRGGGGHILAIALDGRYAAGFPFASSVQANRWSGELRRQFEGGLSFEHLRVLFSGEPFHVRVSARDRYALVTLTPRATVADLLIVLLRLRFDLPLDYAVVWDVRLAHPEGLSLTANQALTYARPSGLPARSGPVALAVGGDIANRWGAAYSRLASDRGHLVRSFDSMTTGVEWVQAVTSSA
jgi:hypothetical protein